MAERVPLVERGIGLHEPITTEMLERRMGGEDVRMIESMVERLCHSFFAELERQELLNATISLQGGKLWIEGSAGIDLKALIRANITAMREPTEGMLNAVDLRKERMMGSGYAWQAMIDAALKP